jgi:transposase-like protein
MNGLTSGGSQKFHCKDCGRYRTLKTTQFYTEERKEEILRSYKERSSLRGTRRIYGVAISTVLRWIWKKS